MSYHVRDVLESGRDTPPAPRTTTDDIIARARRTRTRRRSAALTGGLAAAVAVAAATAGLTAPDAGAPAAGPVVNTMRASSLTPNEVFSTVLGEYRAGSTTIGPAGQVTAGYQVLPVYPAGLTWSDDLGHTFPLTDGAIRVYRPGVFDPATFGKSFPVTVAGRPALGRTVSEADNDGASGAPAPSEGPGEKKFVRTALAWQYEQGAWATYLPEYFLRDESTAEAVKIAEAVTPKPEQEIRRPYVLDYVPPGWETVSAVETPAANSNVVSEVFLHEGPIPAADLAAPLDITLTAVQITVMKGQPKDGTIRGKDGVHCYGQPGSEYSGPACTVVIGDYFIDVDGRFSGLTDAEIGRIVRELKPVDDLADRADWLPID